MNEKKDKQAGAELCQAQQSLKYLPLAPRVGIKSTF